MGNVIELRQIIAEEADAYMRQPLLFVQVERARCEDFSKRWHVDFDYDQYEKEHKQRSYKWKLLFGLVSISKDAFDLLNRGGQPIGGLKESQQLEANAEVLLVEQVARLYTALLDAPIMPTIEPFEMEVALLFQDMLTFLQEAVETGKALLIIESP